MRQLSDYELKAMKGGLSVTAGLVIGAIVIFLAGVLDGFVRPLSCDKDS
ncbi:MAG TPA: hypothetical protein IAC85_06655 [Candidatus Faecenecus gallistercoris]|jgi:FlaG/FlaF family flagellin (archaellin)|uniref:Class IIb bacteriocin, lactobin A/cerein 7B family n=1 Tax=Candidatus Faecenecus gallistercoris TaxID=2840793 RepID=A0A9D0Z0D8_9FIRM|nr:hypothetical protein [Bacillota bacterium]CDE08125.1 unknown [Bacillus sp. CAG:988]HIQ65399.1 hypothetical protein [Candidatus Faecenecus gallistercoris]